MAIVSIINIYYYISYISFYTMLFLFRYIKIVLLPSGSNPSLSGCTKPISDLSKPRFGDSFAFNLPSNKLCTKTLQVNVWGLGPEDITECLVSFIVFNIVDSLIRYQVIIILIHIGMCSSEFG